jgi:integrase
VSIYKPRNSPYWHYDFRRRGLRFCGSTQTGDRRKAVAVEEQRKRQADSAAAAIRAAGEKPLSWGLAAARFQAEIGKHYRGGGAKDCLRALAWLTARIGFDTALTAIDGNRVAMLVAIRRGEGVAPATVNRSMTEVLRKVLRRASEAWGCAVPRIAWREHMLAEPQPIVREITVADEERLVAAEREDYVPVRRFAALTGCRMGEIVDLTWPDVDFGNRLIRVTGKGGKSRTIPMTPEIRELLWALRGHHARAVFTYRCVRTSAGRKRGSRYPITREGLKTRARRAGKKAGVAARFHDLRHTFATRVLRGSGNLRVVQTLLGHEDPKTTAKYAHVLAEDLRAAMLVAVGRDAENPEEIPETTERKSSKL